MKRLTAFPIVILALFGLVSLTCSAPRRLFIAATPTASMAPTPTVTAIPTTIPTETPLPTATKSTAGAYTDKLADGSTKFTDKKAGYQLVLSPAWIVIDLSSGNVQQAIATTEALHPEQSGTIEAFRSLMNSNMRIFAIDTTPEHIVGMTTPTLFVLLDNTIPAMSLDFLVKMLAEQLPAEGPGMTVVFSETRENPNGLRLGVIEVTMPVDDLYGNTIVGFERAVLFQNQGYTVMIMMVADAQLRPKVTPVFIAIEDTIKLLP